MWKKKKPLPKEVAVIILAGGNSTRMGVNKQWIFLKNQPVLSWTIQAFEECALVEEIIVVTKGEDIPQVHQLVKSFGFHKVKEIIKGGETRQASAKAGFSCVSEEMKMVLVHDGARPFVTEAVINQVILDVKTHGAAVASVPMKDTIKEGTGTGFVKGTPQRDRLFMAQTPQGFTRDLYEKALQLAKESDTDDCQMVETMGKPVFLSQGSYENIKLTTAEDIPLGETILQMREEQ